MNVSFFVLNYVCLFREFARRLREDPNYHRLHKSFKIDAMMIMEFNICMCEYKAIPLEALFSGRTMLATANCSAVRRMLGDPGKRDMMEKHIDDMGLEHLGHIRYIDHGSGTFVDLWGDDRSHTVKKFKKV